MRILILMSLMTSAIWQQHSTQADTEIDKDSGTANTYITVTAPTTDNLYLTQAPDFNFANTEASTKGSITTGGTVVIEPFVEASVFAKLKSGACVR